MACSLALAACAQEPSTPGGRAPPSTGERALVTASEFQAGAVTPRTPVANPVADDPQARAQGQRLFLWFNCAGCHGVLGGGGIGPPLRDGEWIYGPDPSAIFQSIAQGRPNGMPAFGGKIPDEEIWKLALYVRSLGAAAEARGPGRSAAESPTGEGRRTQ